MMWSLCVRFCRYQTKKNIVETKLKYAISMYKYCWYWKNYYNFCSVIIKKNLSRRARVFAYVAYTRHAVFISVWTICSYMARMSKHNTLFSVFIIACHTFSVATRVSRSPHIRYSDSSRPLNYTLLLTDCDSD